MCDGFAAVDVGVPSPKFHRYVRLVPSGSLEPAEENLTVVPTGTASLSTVALAIGERAPLM